MRPFGSTWWFSEDSRDEIPPKPSAIALEFFPHDRNNSPFQINDRWRAPETQDWLLPRTRHGGQPVPLPSQENRENERKSLTYPHERSKRRQKSESPRDEAWWCARSRRRLASSDVGKWLRVIHWREWMLTTERVETACACGSAGERTIRLNKTVVWVALLWRLARAMCVVVDREQEQSSW